MLLALRASHATASVTFRQAWQQYCSGREGECSGAHVPQKGYLISLPDDVEKRDYLLPQLKTLGFDIENINGILSDQVSQSLFLQRDRSTFCFTRTLPCTRSHASAVAYPAPELGLLSPRGTLNYAVQETKERLCMQLGQEFTGCTAAMTSGNCQAGLTRAHIEAWRRIIHSGEPAAWVFE